MSVATAREAGTVWVAVMIDRNGHRVMVARSEEGLIRKVAARCLDRWAKVSEEDAPLRAERVIEEYYDRVNGEWLEMGEHRL